MAGEDILISTGVDLGGLQRDFARGLQIAQSFGADLAKVASVNLNFPTIDASTFRDAQAAIGGGGLAGALREAQAALAALTAEEKAEVAARSLAIRELDREISTLSLFGRTVDATSAAAVAEWKREATELRALAEQIDAPRESMLRLDLATQQAEKSFRRAQDAMERLKVPKVDTGNLPAFVNTTGKFTETGRAAANTALSVGLALQSMSTSAGLSESKLKGALNAVSALGLALGPEGILVSAAAQAGIAVADVFDRAAREAKKRADEITKDINRALNQGDFLGLQKQLQEVQLGTRAGTGADGLFAIRKQFEEAQAYLTAHPFQIVTDFELAKGIAGVTADSPLGREIARQQGIVARLRPEVIRLAAEESRLADLLVNPPAEIRAPRGLPTITIEEKGPKAITRELKLETKQAERDLERWLRGAKQRTEASPLVVTMTMATIKPQALEPITLDQAKFDLAFVGFQQHVKDLRAAADQVDFSRMLEGGAALKTAEANLKAAKDAAVDAAKAFALLASVKAPDEYAATIAKIRAALDGFDISAPSQRIRTITTNLERANITANGLVRIASIFGNVDASVRRALDGFNEFTASIDRARSTVQTLKDLNKELAEASHTTAKGVSFGQFFGSADGLSSLFGIVSGFAGVAEGFLSLANRGPSPEELERNQLIKQNSEEMARLRNDLAGYNGRTAPTALELERIINPATGAGVPRTAIDLAQAQRLAEQLGLSLKIVDSQGRLVAGAMEQLRQAAKDAATALTNVGASFDDQIFTADLRSRLFGLDSSDATKANNELAILAKLAPELGASFRGLDSATLAGQQAIRAGLRHLFEQALNNQISLEDLGGLESVTQLEHIISDVTDYLNNLGKSTQAATEALGNVPEGFKRMIDQARFDALQPINQPLLPRPFTPTPLPLPTTAGLSRSPISETPQYVYAPNFSPGAIVIQAEGESGEELLAKIDRALVVQGRAVGGSLHIATRGLVHALSALDYQRQIG